MITFLYSVIAVFALLAVFDFLDYRRRNPASLLAAIAGSPFVWSALTLAAVVLLLPSHHLSWPFVVAAPLASFGLVTLSNGFIMTACKRFGRSISGRSAARVLLLCVAAELACAGWTVWPTESAEASQTVRRAEQRARRIETAQKVVQATLVSMHTSIDEVPVLVVNPSRSLKEIEQTALELIEIADTANRQYRELVADYERLQAELNDAPAVYRDAAGVWHQYAAEEEKNGYPDLAQRYEEIAALWDAHADAIESNQETFLGMQQLEEAMKFVRRARVLLARLAAHISELPYGDVLGTQAELEANLALFVQRFDQLRDAIKGLTQQLREHGEPPSRPTKAIQEESSDEGAPRDRTTQNEVRTRPTPLEVLGVGGRAA